MGGMEGVRQKHEEPCEPITTGHAAPGLHGLLPGKQKSTGQAPDSI